MKHYKLLKDTLTVKAGSIFEEKETFDGEKKIGSSYQRWIPV